MARWTTVVRRDAGVFDELRPWWDAQLVPRTYPMMRARIMSCWEPGVDEPGSERHVRLLYRGDELVAALPLYRVRGRYRSMGRHFGDAFDVVCVDDPQVRERIPGWVARMPAVQLYRVPEDSPVFAAVPHRSGWTVHDVVQIRVIDLADGMDGLTASLSKGFVKGLRRRRRRLHELGAVELVDRPASGPEDPSFVQGLAMERAGWKGERGEAVLNDPESLRWYSSLARVAGEEGWLMVSELRLDGKVIAFACDLRLDGFRHGLLSAYDESPEIARLSPGNLLLEDILGASVASGVHTYDLGPGKEPWKADWSSSRRVLYDLRLFGSGPTGRALAATRGRAVQPIRTEPDDDQ